MNKLSLRDLEHLLDENYDDFKNGVAAGFQKVKKKTDAQLEDEQKNKKKGHFHVKPAPKTELDIK